MIVTYSPADGQQRTWQYKSAELPSADAEALEEVVPPSFDEWQQQLLRGGAKARRALLWVLLRRDDPTLKFGDVEFRMGELEVEFDSDEKQRALAEVEKDPNIAEEDKAQLRELLADQGGDEQGKGRTPDDHSEGDG